jgi:nucleoside 2-deoxyribosyltransferase
VKPKIYVSGPSRDLERCERAIALCRELGAEITYDWTVDVRANAGQSTPSDPDVQRTIALADLDGVAAADVMVFLDADSPSPGRWVEVGAAWGCKVPIIASVDGVTKFYIWHQLMECTTDDAAACYRAAIQARKRAAERQPPLPDDYHGPEIADRHTPAVSSRP